MIQASIPSVLIRGGGFDGHVEYELKVNKSAISHTGSKSQTNLLEIQFVSILYLTHYALEICCRILWILSFIFYCSLLWEKKHGQFFADTVDFVNCIPI